ncbi:MAG: hypothetical protein OEM04_07990 [Flavobacteriaceae bacterium]|nr:hypothetical protein [Flavobacteriaceae bacterium]
MSKKHSFHIPVMGIGFTIDTPLKVSQYGMDSVISVVDDILLEKLRKMYCEKFEMPYNAISEKIEDFRAKRITSYLNLINKLAEKKFDEVKNTTIEKSNGLKEYFSMLPDSSSIKKEFKNLTAKNFNINELKSWAKNNLTMGSIDVNIMTKVDKENFKDGEKLPSEFNDAHAALRGFANSDLESSVILSAGMSPRLYSYIEQFDDFFPNENGHIKKKIVLKVSDYRSALIQGKFLAKKGLWVSEYRIESGLNCGGHAFATDGFLMGPILEEFKLNRVDLINAIHDILLPALAAKSKTVPAAQLALKITAQGGVGTGEEHQFLLDHYQIDSVGWGTPFLLVPEATTVDEKTIDLLSKAEEKDLYLSNISPLGVPFNSLRGNTKDIEKLEQIKKGRPGSSCPKEFLSSNKEFTEKNICTASRQYQRNKIKELDNAGVSESEYQSRFEKITDKSCICVGLGTSALMINNIERKVEKEGVSICPGPNMAYFSKVMSLKEITDHIYNRANMMSRSDRPNMFIKELNIYIDYLKNKIEETNDALTQKQEKYLITFSNNLKEGINYYHNLFYNLKDKFDDTKSNILYELEESKKSLSLLHSDIENLTKKMVIA